MKAKCVGGRGTGPGREALVLGAPCLCVHTPSHIHTLMYAIPVDCCSLSKSCVNVSARVRVYAPIRVYFYMWYL